MALKILLADDSMTAQNMGKKILTDAGYEVVAVSNGAAAVKKIAEINPHLCILDIYMPGYTGLEVCEKVKSSPATARLPVLLTVGKMEPYKPEEGARVRADGVIVKPFEASELLRAVQRFSARIPGVMTPAATPAEDGAAAAAAAPSPMPPPPPVSTPATYEKTVKLTREQLQEIIDPNSPKWQSGTASPEVAAPAAAVNVGDVVANTKTASTSDAMPGIAVVAVADIPAALAEVQIQPAMTSTAATGTAVALAPEVALVATKPEAALPNASAVLAGFVDYLIAQETSPVAATAVSANTDFAVQADAPTVPEALVVEPTLIQASDEVHSTGIEVLSTAVPDTQKDYDIPARDPALEVAPDVSIVPTPDPHFESVVDLPVANATEEGLQPTSRASESHGVVTTADPNLSPMDGLQDAVHPLEGGRFTPPQPPPVAEAAPVEVLPEPAPAVVPPVETIAAAPEPPPAVEAPAPPSQPSGKKGKKGKEMRAIPAPAAAPERTTAPAQEAPVIEKPAEVVAEAPAPAAEAAKTAAPSEIEAVLDLIGQTIPSSEPPAPAPAAMSAVEEMTAPTPLIAAATPRVWMAEEVALTEVESTISLENEMRIAYATKDAEHHEVAEIHAISTAVVEPPAEMAVAVAPAEAPVRDDKTAPKSAIPGQGGQPPDTGPSPTQELAAAMAAAFGGALPKEDLARAEETQSISEEVRRFALGDAYKPKPSFGGAAVDVPEEHSVTKDKLAAAISRALDRLKPQLVAEILKELEGPKEE